MRSETLSVVVATYNGAAYLEEQLRSLTTQTRPPDEIVIADDGSTDGTLALVARCAAASSVPMRLSVNPVRYGYADNFLRAASRARGQWIAFCDQDDVWRRDKLARVGAYFDDPGVLAVSHRAAILKNGRVTGERSYQAIARTEVLSPLSGSAWRMFAGFSIVFRRQLIAELPFEDRPENRHRPGEKLPHDEWISFLALSLGKVAVIAEPLVAHRHHANNASRASWPGRTWHGEARAVLSRGESDLVRAVGAAEDRAHYLARVGALRAAAHYLRVAELSRARCAIWRGSSVLERARALGAVWGAGGYAEHTRGGMGRRELVKDALLGVLRSQSPERAPRAALGGGVAT